MKKMMIVACAGLLSGVICAEEACDMQKVKDTAKTITFTMTISRDDTYDAQAWNETVQLVARAAKVANDAEQDNAKKDDVIDATLRAIKETYERCGNETGINGDLTILLDDDQEDIVKDCGAVCQDCDCSEVKGCDGICGGEPREDK